jgi:3-hydroxyisobutyrate dehydrogenase-like beta-hydroxyacid dehydrogenase
VKTLTPRMTAGEYTPPHFSLRLMAKDLTYARTEARFGLALDTATCALTLFERAIAEGHADRDFAAVVEPKRATVS